MALLGDLVRAKVERQHEDDEARKKQIRDDLHDIVFNHPNPDSPSYQYFEKEYHKLLSPDAKKAAQQGAGAINRLKQAFGRGGKQQDQQAAPQPQQPVGPPQYAQGAASRAPGIPTVTDKAQGGEAQTISPKQKFDAGPPATPTMGQALSDYQKVEEQRAREAEAYKSKLDTQSKIDVEKAKPQPVVKTPVTLRMKDGSSIQAFRSKDGAYSAIGGELLDPDSIEKEEGKKVNTQLAWFSYPDDKPGAPPHAVRVNPRDPKDIVDASTGEAAPRGATQVNPAMIEAQIRQNSYGQFGNLERSLEGQGYSQEEAKRYAGQLVEADYQKRLSLLGAGSIHEAIGQDAEGNAITIPLQNQRRPAPISAIPPPAGGGAAAGPPAATPAPATTASPATPSTPKPAPTSARPQANAAPPAATATSSGASPSLAPRMLPGVSAATAKTAAQYSAPITESVVQLFGDPKNPSVKSLLDYSKLADDPQSSERIGTAIRLTLSGFGDSIGEASVGGGEGGLHVSSGGFGTWLQNKLGVPGAVATQQANLIKQAMTAMTPEEREAYDATMAEMSVMAGLRSISKSSAAMGSIRLIENEIPKIGINTADSTQFIDQLQKTASAINNAVNTPGIFPRVNKNGKQVPVGIQAEMLERINNLPSELQKLKKGPAKAPDSKGPAKATSARPRAEDGKGNAVEWDGKAWIPVAK